MPDDNDKLALPQEAREKLSEAFAKRDLALLDALIVGYILQNYDLNITILVELLRSQDPETIKWWNSPSSLEKDPS